MSKLASYRWTSLINCKLQGRVDGLAWMKPRSRCGLKTWGTIHAMCVPPNSSQIAQTSVNSNERTPTKLPVDTVKAKNSTSSLNHRMILIDGSSVLFRAYFKIMAKVHHGFISDGNSEADWVLTVFTAFSTILGVLDLGPSHVLVVFDHKGGLFGANQLCLTFRHTLFPDYKKNRAPTPDTVLQGLDHLKPALLSLGVKVLEVPGVEADDVIATVALSAAAADMKVRVVSPDKDFFQILSPNIRLLRSVPHGSEMVSFGLKEFKERFGNLEPAQFVDVLSLIGDTADNIPGIPGIGEKTAIDLITEFGSVENLLKEKQKVKSKRALKGLLADNGEALLSKRLVALRSDLPSYMIPFSLDDYRWQKPHDEGEKLFQLLKALDSFVDASYCAELEERIVAIWQKHFQ